MTRQLRVFIPGEMPIVEKPDAAYQLEHVGVSGAWLVSVWKRISCNDGDQYTETETQFRNQQGELIASYFESTLSQRKVAEESPEKKP